MTGSVAIDVVIGLIFIYLLYSLFATVIMEIVNTFLGLRARNLRYALRRMLMDEKQVKWIEEKPDDSYWMISIKNILNQIPGILTKLTNTVSKIWGRSVNLSDPGLFHTFYNQPSIKYLSAGGIANKPSYIAPRNFSKTIIDSIQANYSSKGILNKIHLELDVILDSFDRLEATHEIKQTFENRDSLRTGFKEWFAGLADIQKIKFGTALLPYDHDLKIQLYSISDLEDITPHELDRLLKASMEGKSLLEKIKAGIAVLPEDSDTRQYLESLLADAQNDLQKFQLYLEQWFNDSMERAGGWFKRRVHYFLFYIGFVLAISFNADTLQIVKKLSDDPKARAHLVDLAIEYAEETKETVVDGQNNTDPDKTTTTATTDNERIKKANDSLLKVAKKLQDDIYKAQNIIASNWYIPDSIEIASTKKIPENHIRHRYNLVVLDSFEENGKKVIRSDTVTVSSILHTSIDLRLFEKSVPPVDRTVYQKGTINVNQFKYKLNYVFAQEGWNFKRLWGYVLTALAISMGSPFWFDLLNKLVQLRNSIRPQKEDDGSTPRAKEVPLPKRVG